MSKKKKSFKKGFGIVGKVFSWIISIAGLVVSLISMIVGTNTPIGWQIILGIIVMNSIFFIIVSIYETVIYKRKQDLEKTIRDEKDNEIATQKNEYETRIKGIQKELNTYKTLSESQRNYQDDLLYYNQYSISTMNKYATKLPTLNYELRKTIDEIEGERQELERSGSISDEIVKMLTTRRNNATIKYANGMIYEFDHFLRTITDQLKIVLDEALRIKGSTLEVSLSVKQLNNIYIGPGEALKDMKVITTFRDNKTYTNNKDRELGERAFLVKDNTAFNHCINNPESYYFKNNIVPGDPNYTNEHKEFSKFYNSVIVVPIKCKYPVGIGYHIYGFLTCDILNSDMSQGYLDESMAKIMLATADILGNYFDSMDFQWQSMLGLDFLQEIFEMKKKF